MVRLSDYYNIIILVYTYFYLFFVWKVEHLEDPFHPQALD